jgi:hypothetical protein
MLPDPDAAAQNRAESDTKIVTGPPDWPGRQSTLTRARQARLHRMSERSERIWQLSAMVPRDGGERSGAAS